MVRIMLSTMVGQTMVNHGQPCSTMVQPWLTMLNLLQLELTIAKFSFIQSMVNLGQPWLRMILVTVSMVNHG